MEEFLKRMIECALLLFVTLNAVVASTSTTSSTLNITATDCHDTISTCHLYGREICFKEVYRPWVRAHCAAHCQWCDVGNATNCTDTVPNCSEYDHGGLCTEDKFYIWAFEHCKDYCRFGECSKGPLNCSDTLPNCHKFDDGTLCTEHRYYAWAYDHCRGYCGFGECNGTNVTYTNTQDNSTQPSTSGGPTVCRNVDNKCSHYGRDLCKSKFYEPWTKTHCALYCGFCTPDTPDDCENKAYDCQSYDGGDLCTKESYYAWAYDYCKGYCGFGNCKNSTSAPASAEPLVG